MHNVDEVLKKVKTKQKITLEVNGKTFPIYFDCTEDKRLFVELMSDYFEDMECQTDAGKVIDPRTDYYV